MHRFVLDGLSRWESKRKAMQPHIENMPILSQRCRFFMTALVPAGAHIDVVRAIWKPEVVGASEEPIRF
ncbi:MAG: hypothetical protein HY842_14550 [Bacteroidetes bacterium]|nr:hypothetical protein [Bacteroidota bacterium]